MSRNGSGVYTLPAGNPVVTGTTISSTTMNNTLNDIASALTGSLSADGQTPLSGNLNANSNKIVNLTNPSSAQDGATKYYVDNAPYLQGASGSVTRTVTNKLQETVSLKDFGATLDGTTSDQTAFSNAINSGASQIIISGTCYLTSSITVPSTTALQFSYGSKIKIASGQTLTVASQIIADDAPIFVLPYSVSFTGNQAQIKPKWLNV